MLQYKNASSYGYNKIINEIITKSNICTDDKARP